jgi:hypothetical protein
MLCEETDITFRLRASISIKITYSPFYRKIMLASVVIVWPPVIVAGRVAGGGGYRIRRWLHISTESVDV